MPTPRHPGLAPGPTQTGRDLKTTTAGCFQDPEYRWGDFGTTDGGVLQPIRHPGLAPGTNKKAEISKQLPLDATKSIKPNT